MPQENFYRGLTLDEALEKMATHHHKQRTRHISQFESSLLHAAVDMLRTHRRMLNSPIERINYPDINGLTGKIIPNIPPGQIVPDSRL